MLEKNAKAVRSLHQYTVEPGCLRTSMFGISTFSDHLFSCSFKFRDPFQRTSMRLNN